ncbi:PREDICTED: transmembrane protein 35-like [Priapulus caudatus]|uniref:Novel acetylcholine receptor chaperone n=1 Tax=Priapulus caudatus TaxID=37621 RepID=A0ABM1DUT3_PRICU|nr:PREDICTED: transmembrane protein 35-like [Priapulus caudatus]
MAALALRVLSITLGLYFCFVGSLKVTPKINEDANKQFRTTFISYSRYFPLSKYHGWRPHPRTYRQFYGYAEIVSGAILVLFPAKGVLRFAKLAANVVLTILMSTTLTSHYLRGDGFETMSGQLVMSLLLLCRLIVFYQVTARENKEALYSKKREEMLRQALDAAEKVSQSKKDE